MFRPGPSFAIVVSLMQQLVTVVLNFIRCAQNPVQ